MVKKIKNFFSSPQIWLILSSILALVAALLSIKAASLIIDYYYPRHKQTTTKSMVSTSSAPQATSAPNHANRVRRLLDGVWVEAGEQNFYPVAVMIDNHPDARPPAGLTKADLVFEALAEGHITRFLAIYDLSNKIDKIGPIRSARPYFLDWVEPLGALYVHCGGSPQALARIKKDKVLDLNEFYHNSYFWRATDRAAPHNVYISSPSLQSYLKKLNLELSQYSTWLYKDENKPASSAEPLTNISINYGDDNFAIEWKYDKINNSYIRWQAGSEHKDEDGSLIQAKNVIIAEVKSEVIDDEGRRQLQTVGQGKVVFCQLGQCQNGVWRKKDAKTRIRFYDKNNQEFRFIPGSTWIEIVPDLDMVEL